MTKSLTSQPSFRLQEKWPLSISELYLTDQNIWSEQPEELPFIDNSKVELFMYTARSREDQAKWVQDLVTNDSEFVNEWWDTFVCRACMSIDRQLGPELQFALN